MHGRISYEFTGTKLEQFPLPRSSAAGVRTGTGLRWRSNSRPLNRRLSVHESVPTRERLDAARAEHERIRGRMIALQEELDWDVYRRYGLITDEEAADLIADPVTFRRSSWGAGLRDRAGAADGAGEVETQWFARHRSTPITEIPAHWPEEYKAVVARRIEIIERRPEHRADRAARVQAAVAVRAVGGQGAGRAHDLAAGPVRGAVAVVRPDGQPSADDGQPAG